MLQEPAVRSGVGESAALGKSVVHAAGLVAATHAEPTQEQGVAGKHGGRHQGCAGESPSATEEACRLDE